MNTQTIGSFFQQFRKGRGITLAEAVQGANCSAAALSRFERDQSDLSVSNVSHILENLQLTVHDFLLFQTDQPGVLDPSVYSKFIGGRTAALGQDAYRYAEAHAIDKDLPMIKYAQFLFALCQRPDAWAGHLTTKEEQQIAAVLTPFPGWRYQVQSTTIVAGLRFASHELLTAVTKSLVAHTESFTADTIDRSVVNNSDMANLLLITLMRREPELSQALAPAMRRYQDLRIAYHQPGPITVDAVSAAPVVNFAEAANQYVSTGKARYQQAAQTVIQQLKDLGASDLAAYLTRMWQLIKTGKPTWHDQDFVPAETHAESFADAEWQFDGPTVKRLRHYFHLSLADVCVSWTPATQSRFEAGKTMLGFKSALALTDALLLDATMFYLAYFPLPYAALDEAMAARGKARVPVVTSALAAAINALPKHSKARFQLASAAYMARARNRLTADGVAA